MKIFRKISSLILIIAFVLIGYHYQKYIFDFFDKLKTVSPCEKPITYSIGTFDNRFGISEQEFESNIEQAVKIWERPLGKILFSKAGNPDLKINLVYDERQDATIKLQKLGLVIHQDKATYDTLQAKYKTQLESYNRQKAAYDKMLADYQAKKNKFDAEVSYWNNQGGAPKNIYDNLQKERSALNALADNLNGIQNKLKSMVDNINAMVNVLNSLNRQLNLRVNDYNTIGAQTDKEFEEGQYVQDGFKREINIYQFTDSDKLVRVLAHELGHALGLEHVDDPQAIMYRLNQSENKKPTEADLQELNRVCRQ